MKDFCTSWILASTLDIGRPTWNSRRTAGGSKQVGAIFSSFEIQLGKIWLKKIYIFCMKRFDV